MPCMQRMEKLIFHVDMDAFYAACEVQRNPELKGKPVIIGADPKNGTGRGVVSTCSYEARKMGLHSAMPISQAYRLCPAGIYLPPDMQYYASISDKVFKILQSYSQTILRASIDEAYLELSHNQEARAKPLTYAKKIQKHILAELGLSSSIGISYSKIYAKIATGMKKPQGITLIDNVSHLTALPVDAIPGVGRKTNQILHSIGVRTVSDLQRYPYTKIQRELGNYGTYLWKIANGLDNSPFVEQTQDHSISRETTFEEDTINKELLHNVTSALSKEVFVQLKEEGLVAKTVTLKVRFSDFSTYTRSKTIPLGIESEKQVEKIATLLLSEFLIRPIRLIGVKLSGIAKQEKKQRRLEEWYTQIQK